MAAAECSAGNNAVVPLAATHSKRPHGSTSKNKHEVGSTIDSEPPHLEGANSMVAAALGTGNNVHRKQMENGLDLESDVHDLADNLGGFFNHSIEIAQSTITHTTKFAMDLVFLPFSLAATVTSTVVHGVSGVSSNVTRIVFGSSGFTADKKLLTDSKGAETRGMSVQNGDDHFLWKIAFHVTNSILGTISPYFSINKPDERYDNKNKSNNQNITIPQRQNDINPIHYGGIIPSKDDKSSTTPVIDFSDSSDESIYYDAHSFISTSEDSEEIPQFYLDLSNILQEINTSIFPRHTLEQDESGALFFEINSNKGRSDSFQNLLEALVESSLTLASLDKEEERTDTQSPWMPEGNTTKVLQHRNTRHYTHDEWMNILENDVLKWTRTAAIPSTNATCRSHAYPILKTRGIIAMPPYELRDLLLDSNRVKEFNKNSLGKKNICILPSSNDDETTVIVEHDMRIPIVGTSIQTLALTHSRPIHCGDGGCGCDIGYIVVSRSVKRGLEEEEKDPFYSISILRPVPNQPEKTDLINVAQMGVSNHVPGFVLRKIGFMGASDFFANLRRLCRK